MKTYEDIVLSAWNKHKELHPMDGYFSLVSLHGIARYAKFTKNQPLLDEMKQFARPYLDGKVEKMCGAYGPTVYRFGGNFTAYLAVRGELDSADIKVLEDSADLLCNTHPRNSQGAFMMPKYDNFLWIDTVFGICPFLLWVGLATGRNEFIDEACKQMKLHHDVLFNSETKTYHQALNAWESKGLSAHWGRGVGWGVFALSEMAYDLPKAHPDYPEIIKMYRDVSSGCLETQDEDGMWHQIVNVHETYPETSGTGLIAYALARGVKNGSLDRESSQRAFIKALSGLLKYMEEDGSVLNCCKGCLAPNGGTVEAYANHNWVLNDPHAFGPMILAFGEAEHLRPLGLCPELNEIQERNAVLA